MHKKNYVLTNGELMSESLDRVTISGFKSIKELTDFKLNKLNVFVGANGAGKSNIISFFRMLRMMMEGNLNRYVVDNGGANDILFKGRKSTDSISAEMHFGERGYGFTLFPKLTNEFAIERELVISRTSQSQSVGWAVLGDSANGIPIVLSRINNETEKDSEAKKIFECLASLQIYHFHDTGPSSKMRGYEIVEDDKKLRGDASNIAPFLLKLKTHNQSDYEKIVSAVKLVTPFFEDFILEPRMSGPKNQVNLSWRQKESDYPFQPYHLSDGTLRFICLATALLQPNPPATIIIDEPELGLHPSAVAILGELIRVASKNNQVIIATQSSLLLDQFTAEDIIVVNREDGASTFKRLNTDSLKVWLEDYSLGELWTKNVIVGGPVYE